MQKLIAITLIVAMLTTGCATYSNGSKSYYENGQIRTESHSEGSSFGGIIGGACLFTLALPIIVLDAVFQPRAVYCAPPPPRGHYWYDPAPCHCHYR